MNGRGCAPAALGLSSRSYAPGLLRVLHASPSASASTHEGGHCTPLPLLARLGAEHKGPDGVTLMAVGLNRHCHDSHILVLLAGLLPFFLFVSAFPGGPLHCPGRPCRGAFAQHL